MISPSDIAQFLDVELDLKSFSSDCSNNGLQVDAPYADVKKICVGVDASLDFFKEARLRGADMCIVHHGLSWGDSLKYISGVNYKLISYLIENNIALYGVHLPLDAHPVYGNNAVLAQQLGLQNLKPFGDYHGMIIGFKGELPEEMPFEDFCVKVRSLPHKGNFRALGYGKCSIKTVGIISGGAADSISQAASDGLDVFLTGEVDLQSYNECKHLEMNMIAAGHYSTECGGVEALAALLREKFGVVTEFVDLSLDY
ncbi:MAG: Nif3-like dinuclear metal center hexameric protein [Kiritimatiellae bacterium]|nr:Nif3-like dinuclear metal center hexameric protein [Kiritimatiellia bacterium]